MTAIARIDRAEALPSLHELRAAEDAFVTIILASPGLRSSQSPSQSLQIFWTKPCSTIAGTNSAVGAATSY